jgi:hypothetical protein
MSYLDEIYEQLPFIHDLNNIVLSYLCYISKDADKQLIQNCKSGYLMGVQDAVKRYAFKLNVGFIHAIINNHDEIVKYLIARGVTIIELGIHVSAINNNNYLSDYLFNNYDEIMKNNKMTNNCSCCGTDHTPTCEENIIKLSKGIIRKISRNKLNLDDYFICEDNKDIKTSFPSLNNKFIINTVEKNSFYFN